MEASDPDEVETINQEIGKWFADYLVGSGYTVSKLNLSIFVILGNII